VNTASKKDAAFGRRHDIRASRFMKTKDRVQLRFGPYRTPRFRYGDVVFCERCGEVTVRGLSAARISWPTCRRGRGRAIILCGDLVEAVHRESSIAVQYWWSVGGQTVWRWRKALGVEARTEGTRAIMRDYANEPRMEAIRARAWAKARDQERRAKISVAMRGKSPPAHLLKALHEGNRGRRHSKETRRKMSETHRRRGTRPPHGRVWRPEEDELLRTLSRSEVASLTGRTLVSITKRRRTLQLPDGRRHKGKRTR
jgi:hypothetical protein